jgi:hypothetical protein
VTNEAAGVLFLALGSVLLVVAIFFPQSLGFIPGNHWSPTGRQASRFGSIASGGVGMLVGLGLLDAVPRAALGVVAVVWGSVLIAAFIHDHAQPDERTGAPPARAARPSRREEPRRPKKRKKRGHGR